MRDLSHPPVAAGYLEIIINHTSMEVDGRRGKKFQHGTSLTVWCDDIPALHLTKRLLIVLHGVSFCATYSFDFAHFPGCQ
jgi:hypothetical protein